MVQRFRPSFFWFAFNALFYLFIFLFISVLCLVLKIFTISKLSFSQLPFTVFVFLHLFPFSLFVWFPVTAPFFIINALLSHPFLSTSSPILSLSFSPRPSFTVVSSCIIFFFLFISGFFLLSSSSSAHLHKRKAFSPSLPPSFLPFSRPSFDRCPNTAYRQPPFPSFLQHYLPSLWLTPSNTATFILAPE